MSVRVAEGSRPSIPVSTRFGLLDMPKLRVALGGSLASLGLLLLELLLVLSLRRAEVSSVWEVQNGAVLLLPVFLALAVLTGASGGLLLQLLARAERSRAHRFMLGLLVATGVALAAFGVGGGRHLAGAGARTAFALVAASVTCTLLVLAAPQLGGLLRRRPSSFALGAAASV